MKIIQINDTLGDIGGAERSFHATCSLLREHGHQVRVIGSEKGEDALSWFRRWFSFSAFRLTKKIIREFEPDIVHCHNLSRVISVSPILAASQLEIPVVLTLRDPHLMCAKSWAVTKNGQACPHFSLGCLYRCHGDNDSLTALPYYFLKYLKLCLHRLVIDRHCTHFICPSSKLFNLTLQNFSNSLQRTSYLPNFIEFDSQCDSQPEINPTKFLFVGRLSKVKGIDTALNALSLLNKEEQFTELKFDIIGEGPERNSLEKLTENLNLKKHVSFLGKVDNNQLAPHYYAACAVVMPSLWIENNPRVALEAMKYGTPLIASRQGGFVDLIDHERSGYLFETGSVQQLADSIRLLYNNKELSGRLGIAGYKKLTTSFSKALHYQKLISIYNRCRQEIVNLHEQ